MLVYIKGGLGKVMVELGLHELHNPEVSIVEPGGCNGRWKTYSPV
jgi:hypothetical protein